MDLLCRISQKKIATVKRSTQSLVVIYKKDEQKADEEKYFDFIDGISEEDLRHEQKKKKIIVKAPTNTVMMSDI